MSAEATGKGRRYNSEIFDVIDEYTVVFPGTTTIQPAVIFATQLGITFSYLGNFRLLPWGAPIPGTSFDDDLEHLDDDDLNQNPNRITEQNGLLYLLTNTTNGNPYGLAEIGDTDAIDFITHLNIATSFNLTYDFHADLYSLSRFIFSITITKVLTLDIRKYRPITKNTKPRFTQCLPTKATQFR